MLRLREAEEIVREMPRIVAALDFAAEQAETFKPSSFEISETSLVDINGSISFDVSGYRPCFAIAGHQTALTLEQARDADAPPAASDKENHS